MTTDLDRRLDAALERRSDLEAKRQRLEGKLEAARKNLEAVEAECRKKGVEPDKLDETITLLSDKYTKLIITLEQEVQAAGTALAPYLKES